MVTQATVDIFKQLYAEKKDIIDHRIQFPSDEVERKSFMYIRNIATGNVAYSL